MSAASWNDRSRPMAATLLRSLLHQLDRGEVSVHVALEGLHLALALRSTPAEVFGRNLRRAFVTTEPTAGGPGDARPPHQDIGQGRGPLVAQRVEDLAL